MLKSIRRRCGVGLILAALSTCVLTYRRLRNVTVIHCSTVAALHHGRAGQMTWLEDPPPCSRPGSVLSSPAYCFASVIVWRENKNVTISDRILFYFDGETALAACVLRATTNKRSSIFWGKSASGWPGWKIFWPRNDLAPLLRWRRHWCSTSTQMV